MQPVIRCALAEISGHRPPSSRRGITAMTVPARFRIRAARGWEHLSLSSRQRQLIELAFALVRALPYQSRASGITPQTLRGTASVNSATLERDDDSLREGQLVTVRHQIVADAIWPVSQSVVLVGEAWRRGCQRAEPQTRDTTYPLHTTVLALTPPVYLLHLTPTLKSG